MNSSIFDSESKTAQRWADWITFYVAGLVSAALWLYVFIVVLDPFSTGWFTPFDAVDIAFSGRAEADAGRVRDPAFDSAILGNSIATRIQPAKLNAATNRRFVTLAIPGLGPDDELMLARSFVRGHASSTRTLVFMMETFWCVTSDNEMYRYPRFPNWLYGSDRIAYLRNILSAEAAQAAFHRVGIRLGFAPEPARRDAYVPSPEAPAWRPLSLPIRPSAAPAKPWNFIALDRLRDFRRVIASDVELIMYFVPFHRSMLPQPDSDAASFLQACKARAQLLADESPRTVLIDRMRDDEVAGDLDNFYDGKHVRDHIVRFMESEIATAVNKLQ